MDNEPEFVQSDRPFPWAGGFLPAPAPGQDSIDFNTQVKFGYLCSKCEGLSAWILEKIGLHKEGRLTTVSTYWHYLTRAELRLSAKRGCHMCSLFSYSIGEDKPTPFKLGGGIAIEFRASSKGKPDTQYSFRLGTEGTVISFTLRRVNSSSPTSHTVPTDAIRQSVYTRSAPFFDIMETWIQNCNVSHTCSGRLEGTYPSAPSRLVELCNMSDSLDLKLIETERQTWKAPYATLSYCWGGVSTFRLQESTLSSMRSGFTSLSLPRTIQDAIIVARQLNLKYVWVDSLCIIQDSVADWTKEAQNMGDVYRNCYLTIAALSSRNSTEGLFAQRDPLRSNSCRLSSDGSNADWFLEQDRLILSEIEIAFEYAHLHSRGWVMQERLLSPRTLNFGDSVYWECCESFLHEFSDEPTFKHEMDGQLLKKRFRPKSAFRRDSEIFENTASCIQFWIDNLLTPYSATEITVKSDRLFALQGIIQDFARSSGWRNLHGLWLPFLVKQCLWRVRFIQKAPLGPKLRGVPSWSWASVICSIQYEGRDDSPEIFRAKVSSSLVGGDVDGLLISSFLTEISPAITTSKSPLKLVWAHGKKYVRLSHYDSFEGRCTFDSAEAKHSADFSCYFLPLLVSATDISIGGQRSGCSQGLVVKRCDNGSCFERVGHFYMKTWQCDRKREEVCFKQVIVENKLRDIIVI